MEAGKSFGLSWAEVCLDEALDKVEKEVYAKAKTGRELLKYGGLGVVYKLEHLFGVAVCMHA